MESPLKIPGQTYYCSFDRIYPPQTEILNDSQENVIEIPLSVHLQGKYLASESGLIEKINRNWNKTIVGMPFAPRTSTVVYFGTTLLSVSEILYSTIASYGVAPIPPKGLDLTCAASALCSLAIVGYRFWQAEKIQKNPYKKLDDYIEWLKENPYFREVFEEINQEEKVIFAFISQEEAEKTKIHPSSAAWYCPNEHTITFLEETESINLIKMIIFECCNAFQRNNFLEFYSKISWDSIPDRNMYGVLIEKIEHNSVLNYHKIVKYGIEHLNWNSGLQSYQDPKTKKPFSFEEIYITQNEVKPEKKVSHTEFYRLCWDQCYAPLFFLKNSEELEKDPELLKFRCSQTNKSLFELIIYYCVEMLKNNDIKTQKEMLIALTTFIIRWDNQKKQSTIQTLSEAFLDIKHLFNGCLLLVFQKENLSKVFIEQIYDFCNGKQTEAPVFDLTLNNLDPSLLPDFISLLKLLKKKIGKLVKFYDSPTGPTLDATEKIAVDRLYHTSILFFNFVEQEGKRA